MELVKLINGNPVPYTEAAFRADNKHTVYGNAISSRHLNAQDVYRVSVAPEPVVPGKIAVLDSLPVQDVNGNWVLGWTLRDYTAAELADWRSKASMSRANFCIALKRMGILPALEAVSASKGEWPTTFSAALVGLPVDADEAQIVWASASVISRNDPVLEAVAPAAGLTPEQVDVMFGWGV